MLRRTFITASTLAASDAMLHSYSPSPSRTSNTTGREDYFPHGPIRSYQPVVGDGRWIWRDPPASERGYLEPRSFELSIGVELLGTGDRSHAMASTPVPVNHPEQTVDAVTIEKIGCEAAIRELAPGAGQLILHASNIMAGQVVKAIAHYKLTIMKQYHGYARDQFPDDQVVPLAIRNAALGESPGIQSNAGAVKKLATELTQGIYHPWDKAQVFVIWIQEHIHPQYQPYTSVVAAIEKRVGDCEEMSALFVAMCRASGIPARLVWVPNHNWTEFYMSDNDGQGHWIPVHPACYHWFGWTGVHELVLQKGDRIKVPEQSRNIRLIMDWMRSSGAKPRATYIAELRPVANTTGGDSGPGTRSKDARTGEWKLTGTHEFDRVARR
ncbi:MAG: transglutaminase-like domain-containing protein [Pirellula sp.]